MPEHPSGRLAARTLRQGAIYRGLCLGCSIRELRHARITFCGPDACGLALVITGRLCVAIVGLALRTALGLRARFAWVVVRLGGARGADLVRLHLGPAGRQGCLIVFVNAVGVALIRECLRLAGDPGIGFAGAARSVRAVLRAAVARALGPARFSGAVLRLANLTVTVASGKITRCSSTAAAAARGNGNHANHEHDPALHVENLPDGTCGCPTRAAERPAPACANSAQRVVGPPKGRIPKHLKLVSLKERNTRSQLGDLNPRPAVYETAALPLS